MLVRYLIDMNNYYAKAHQEFLKVNKNPPKLKVCSDFITESFEANNKLIDLDYLNSVGLSLSCEWELGTRI